MEHHTLETLRIEGDGPVRHLVLDRPSLLNAINARMLEDITDACHLLGRDPEVRVVVLRGEGRCFSAGADLKEGVIGQAKAGGLAHRARLGQMAVNALAELAPVTIAAVHGHVIGGGSCLAAACDFRIAADTARVCVLESRLGISLSWNSVPNFVHLVGPSRAKEMIMFGEVHEPQVLEQWGYFNKVVPEGKLLAAVERLAGKVLAQPPFPVEMAKTSINAMVKALDRAIFHQDPYGLALTASLDDATLSRERLAAEKEGGPVPAPDWKRE